MPEALISGDSHPPLIEDTIGDCFDKQVATYGDRLALVVIPQVCPPAPASLKDTTLKQTSILSFLSSVFFLLSPFFCFLFLFSIFILNLFRISGGTGFV